MEERHANVVFDILGSLKHSAFAFVCAVTLCDPFVTEMKYKSNIRHTSPLWCKKILAELIMLCSVM